MNTVKRVLLTGMGVLIVFSIALAQSKIDDQRMNRDLEVAENVLSSLFKQQFGRRNFFPLELKGTYTEGYGVTFRLPDGFNDPVRLMMIAPEPPDPSEPIEMEWSDDGRSFSYSYHNEERDCEDCEKIKLKNKIRTPRTAAADTVQSSYDEKFIEASKNFIADYGDLISQLSPEEKIMITNQSDNHNSWFRSFRSDDRNFITVEAIRGDINLGRQGKITREQLLSKIKVTRNQLSDKLEPDLELLSSIFGRLYQPDLAKTFFLEGDIYYERLKDFGVTYFMKSYSSRQDDSELYSIPTLKLKDLDQETRDKKVKELYPVFEAELKENMLDYGKTVKSLRDDENLIFNVRITRCKGCNIPSTLELSVKNATLKDFSAGKISKEAALGKISVKKGANQ